MPLCYQLRFWCSKEVGATTKNKMKEKETKLIETSTK